MSSASGGYAPIPPSGLYPWTPLRFFRPPDSQPILSHPKQIHGYAPVPTQFISDYNREEIIEIGLFLPKLS